jgi:hypothetical protein
MEKIRWQGVVAPLPSSVGWGLGTSALYPRIPSEDTADEQGDAASNADDRKSSGIEKTLSG